ncbi:3-keto-disaccharide hydrolase [Verrucomicrobiota bacterium sgz303538]
MKLFPSLLALAAMGTFAHAQATSEVINEPTAESEVINEPAGADTPTPLNTSGVHQLFNGRSLDGWNGLPDFWSVKDGAITGQTTAEKPTQGNTFLVWQGGEVGDFELHFKYKIKGGNSGVQYRSKLIDRPKFVVSGYQADFEAGKTYSGILYEEKARGILAQRGQKTVVKEGEDPKKPKIEVVGEVGKSDEIQAAIKPEDWNDYVIIAKGNHLQHFINGKQTVDVVDETGVGAKKGILALQVHAGPPMMVQFKDMTLKELK